MNTSSDNSSFTNLVSELKPLIVLYAERFWEYDINTGKPPIDNVCIQSLKSRSWEEGLSQDFLSLLEAEVRKDGTRLMRSRKHLKAVKVEPNAQGNVFHNKELILEKIVGIIEEYKNREKDTL